ncbi:MAG: polyphenol oxidase family protein [Deltaproteobacteria bacterium]|nr:polyphenol oxidase family protein [Deltaproteobacteria bacterium]
MFLQKTCNSTNYWTLSRWDEAGLLHGFVGRDIDVSGSNLKFHECFGKDKELVLLSQVHGNKIVDVGKCLSDKIAVSDFGDFEADAWMKHRDDSAERKIVLGIKTADCFPVLMWDPNSNYCAALHCGWRSTMLGIVEVAVSWFCERGARVQDIELAIGPGAQSCCYEVGLELIEQFSNSGAELRYRQSSIPGKIMADIATVISDKARSSGLIEKKIFCLGLCTICDSRFFSFRREKSQAGRQLSFIC